MKRAWMKKVNAVPTNADNVMEEQLKPVQPKVRRRLRTSVAMFGLAISMGGPTLLLTRHDRTPAAETPESNEPITNTVAVAATTNSFSAPPPSSVVIEAVSAPIAPPPISSVTPAANQPAPVVTQQQPQSIAPVKLKVAATKTTTVPIARPQPVAVNVRSVNQNAEKQPALAAPAASVTQRQKRLVQKLKAATTTLSVAVNNEPQKVELPVANTAGGSETNTKQKLLVDRLKQQSNHLQNSSAELRFEESKSSIASEAIAPAQPSIAAPVVETQPARVGLPSTTLTNRLRHPKAAIMMPRQPQYVAPNQNQLGANILASPPVGTSNHLHANTQNSNSLSPASLFQSRLSAGDHRLNSVPSVGEIAQPLAGISNKDVVVETTLAMPRVLTGLNSPQPQISQTTNLPPASTVPDPLVSTAATDSHEPTLTPVIPPAPAEFGLTDDVFLTESATPAAQTTNIQAPVVQEQLRKVTSDAPARAETPAPTPVYVISDGSSESSEVQVGIAAPAIDYQVKRGDTLSAIARQHQVPLSELISANQITNPDRLEVAQTLVIPTEEHNDAVVGQTIAIINRPPQSDTRIAQADIVTLTTESRIADPDHAVGEQSIREVSTTDVAANFTGIGGSFSNEEPLDPPSLYAQRLQADIQRLRQKYNAQQTSHQPKPNKSVSEVAIASTAKSTPATSSSRRQTAQAQPVNPEFRVAQATANQANTTKARLATAPTNVDPTEALQSLRGRQVSPELPPLGAVDIYLPKPNAAPFKGYIWPAKGVLTSGYGWRWGRMHRGIDVAAPVGTPIVAAASGVVVRAGWNSGGYGKLVDIRHADGSLTRYAHNNRILVRPGQQVEQGKQIAEMGSTGFSTGPHLHFELHPSGGKGAVNPMAMLPRR